MAALSPLFPVYLDFETRSTVKLKEVGAYQYVNHPSTELICYAVARGDEEPKIFTNKDGVFPYIEPNRPVKESFIAHNAFFEYCIMQRFFKAYCPPHAQWSCTMAQAAALSLPHNLHDLVNVLNVPQKKQSTAIILQLSRPRSTKGGKVVWWDLESAKTDNEFELIKSKIEELHQYCLQDVRAMRAAYLKMPKLSRDEHIVWLNDFKINWRGIPVDIPALEKAKVILTQQNANLDQQMNEHTGGVVESCNAVKALAKYVGLESVNADAVVSALANDYGNPEQRRALSLRQLAGQSSTAKVNKFLIYAAKDERCRGLFKYYGASTGRWSGQGVQLQNLPRPNTHISEIEWYLRNADMNLEELDLFASPMGIIRNAIRSFIKAKDGTLLVGGDWSAIENRVLLWLAGDQKTLDKYREGRDLYVEEAALVYNKSPRNITKEERQMGKVMTLSLGYQGWYGAFVEMSKGYGLNFESPNKKKYVENLISNWRRKHPLITKLWWDVADAALYACRNPSKIVPFGKHLRFFMRGKSLCIQLPSKRLLWYPKVHIGHDLERNAPQIQYYHRHPKTSRWVVTTTYGGKLVENIVQAISRDLLANAIVKVSDAGGDVVLHVHDEIVLETPDSIAEFWSTLLKHTMELNPEWAPNLPLNVETWVGARYRK